MFSLENFYVEPNRVIMRQGDETNYLIIIEHGQVEIFIEFDGNEFIIEKLQSGSVINHTNLYNQMPMKVNIRASSKGAHLLLLRFDTLNNIKDDYKDL